MILKSDINSFWERVFGHFRGEFSLILKNSFWEWVFAHFRREFSLILMSPPK